MSRKPKNETDAATDAELDAITRGVTEVAESDEDPASDYHTIIPALAAYPLNRGHLKQAGMIEFAYLTARNSIVRKHGGIEARVEIEAAGLIISHILVELARASAKAVSSSTQTEGASPLSHEDTFNALAETILQRGMELFSASVPDDENDDGREAANRRRLNG